MIIEVTYKEDQVFVLGTKGVFDIEFENNDVIVVSIKEDEGDIKYLCFPLTSIEYYVNTPDKEDL